MQQTPIVETVPKLLNSFSEAVGQEAVFSYFFENKPAWTSPCLYVIKHGKKISYGLVVRIWRFHGRSSGLILSMGIVADTKRDYRQEACSKSMVNIENIPFN